MLNHVLLLFSHPRWFANLLTSWPHSMIQCGGPLRWATCWSTFQSRCMRLVVEMTGSPGALAPCWMMPVMLMLSRMMVGGFKDFLMVPVFVNHGLVDQIYKSWAGWYPYHGLVFINHGLKPPTRGWWFDGCWWLGTSRRQPKAAPKVGKDGSSRDFWEFCQGWWRFLYPSLATWLDGYTSRPWQQYLFDVVNLYESNYLILFNDVKW